MASIAVSRVFDLRTLQLLLVASLLIVEVTAYQGTVCCRKAARVPDNRRLYNGSEPWNVCSLNQTDQYPEGKSFLSVNVTLGWCKQTCPGIQYSSLRQWLQPLATWMAPYISLLLLCPVGVGNDEEKKTIKKRPKKARRGWTWVLHLLKMTEDAWHWIKQKAQQANGNVLEYVSILGDPSSALSGAYFEMLSDCQTIRKLVKEVDPVQCQIMQMIVMAGDTEFNYPAKKPTSSDKFAHAIKTMADARPNFFTAVFMPVILMLAVVASVFYDAYTKLGDNDTAHGLAFGIWYSWLLVLAVASNCFASSMNTGLTKRAFEHVFPLSKRRVPLRERYINSKRWDSWLTGHTEIRFPWTQMLIGQFFGWTIVAFTSSCAAAISYTTPTVGLGCRSFTFLLYGVIAFFAAVLRVGCQWSELATLVLKVDSPPKSLMQKIVELSYWLLAWVNAMVLVIGTILHLAGAFRSCRCKKLFVSDSSIVELNSNTQLAIDNADNFWLPLGYIAFSIIWILCGAIIVVRKYITVHMDRWSSPEVPNESNEESLSAEHSVSNNEKGQSLVGVLAARDLMEA